MKTKIIKPREANKLLKKRLEKIKKKLPKYWKVFFVKDNPTYKGEEDFLGNVLAGRSMSEVTIVEIENWLKNFKP